MSEVAQTLKGMDAFKEMVAAAKAQAEAAKEAVEAEAQQTLDEASGKHRQRMSACVDAAYIIASADGSTSVEEVVHIADKLCGLTDGEVDASFVRTLIDEAQAKVERDGRDAVIASIGARCTTPNEREMAFLVAGNVSWTGGGIGTQEGLALQAIARAFGWEISHMHKVLARARA